MPRIVSDDCWRRMMCELTAYRSSGLTPQEVQALQKEHQQLLDLMLEPAPLPLDLYGDDDYSVAAGILVDDYDPAADAVRRREEEQWHK
jgi:hypothetical protein